MTKRRFTAGVVVAALVALLAWTFLGSPAHPERADPAPADRRDQAQGPGSFDENHSSASNNADLWRGRAALLSARCDLDAHTVCDGGLCATVAWLPDLDSLRGWASLGWRNPGLFAVSVLGDVGLEPPGGWPCNDAIQDFFSGFTMDISVGDGPGGTWVVCAAASDPAGTDARCARAAAVLGLPWTGGDPDRHL